MSSKEITIEFPCNYLIKVMGPANTDFEARVVGIIRKHTPDLGEGAIITRHSKEGNYISITANIRAKNKQQLDSIYNELSQDDQVLMIL